MSDEYLVTNYHRAEISQIFQPLYMCMLVALDLFQEK